MKRVLILLTVVFSFLLVQTAAANLVDNGDFETGDFTGWNVTYNYPPGPTPFVEKPGHSGDYAAWFAATGTSDDKISQTIATVSDQKYLFSFWLEHYEGTVEGSNEFYVSWNGTSLLDLVNAPYFDWRYYTYLVTATGSTSTIEFSGLEVPAWYVLDDVNVSQVPLPATLLLLGSGLLGLAGLRRFRKG